MYEDVVNTIIKKVKETTIRVVETKDATIIYSCNETKHDIWNLLEFLNSNELIFDNVGIYNKNELLCIRHGYSKVQKF
jgi:hypothetical protein